MAGELQILQALMQGVDLDSITALPARPAWWAQAACREHPEVTWFPERGELNGAAKAICASCPVRAECLAFAQEQHICHGLWGGLTTRQRRAVRSDAVEPRAAGSAGAA